MIKLSKKMKDPGKGLDLLDVKLVKTSVHVNQCKSDDRQ